jgi:ribose transport system ATP-binding protein
MESGAGHPQGARPREVGRGEAPSLLHAQAIAKAFGPVVALRAVDLRVDPGEIHALLGANGAGKSTLVKILAGVHGADSGTVAVNGTRADINRPADALAVGLATVFQDPALIPDLTVDQNFRLTGVDLGQVRRWLEVMNVGDLNFRLLINELPLEALRLLDLARALAHDPQLLLLDEITAALPATQAELVFNVMREWRDRGRSVLFITHRLAEVLRVCDRATILRDGRSVATVVPGEGGEARLVEAMLGEAALATAGERSQRVMAATAPVLLEARDLRSREKVKGVSFQLRSGEILGVAALEGQGQDRLFELLAGERRPQGGEVLVNGEPVQARSPYDMIRQGVVLVPSDRLHALLPKRSVKENLTVPLYNRVTRWLRLAADEDSKTKAAIDRLAIDTRAQRQVRRLSGGNQQKVVLGRWLASGFRTLLCFDPTRGIDIQTKAQIYQLLREIADTGAGILLYTSELQEIPLVCDRVLVLYDGRVVDERPAITATEEELLSAAHGLESTA